MVSFKKQGDESNASESIVDAGTYDVYVEITGNIATKAPVKIGTAVIDSYETKAADFTVTGQEGTYDIYVSYEEENTSATIHVNFGKSFNNYEVAFDIPVVITTQKVVGIEVVDGTDLTYDPKSEL